MTQRTQGTVIKIGNGDGESVAAASDTFSTVGEIIGYDSNMERSMIDKTHFGSAAKEVISGLLEPGQLTIRVNLDNDDTGQAEMQEALGSGQLRNFKLELPGGTLNVCDFKGFVQSRGDSGQPDSKHDGTWTIKRNSVPVWS